MSLSSPLFAYRDGYIQTGVDQIINTRTQANPSVLAIGVCCNDGAFVRLDEVRSRTVVCAQSSTMMPMACVQKNRTAPECCQEML